MEEAYLQELLAKHRLGVLSAAEKQELDKWYLDKAAGGGFAPEPLVVSQRLAELHEAFAFVEVGVVKKIKLWPRIAVAASIAIAVMVGGYFYVKDKDAEKHIQMAENDIAPGKNGATLTLASGRKILISEALAGNIAVESGVKISKTGSGEIVYEVVGQPSGKLAYNTLSTSMGQQSQVRLPDGTLVFLNAGSSLRYPTSFAGLSLREVALSGEGYFEVSKDKAHPFVVASSGQRVEVLGTHFNINSYRDDEVVRTTLLEGSVRVSPLGGRVGNSAAESIILRPDQQAVLTGRSLAVIPVDAGEVASWTAGKFVFNSEPLGMIMKMAERWYGVKVVFQDDVSELRLSGKTSRFDHISSLLKTLEATDEVDFVVQGRTVLVSRAKR